MKNKKIFVIIIGIFFLTNLARATEPYNFVNDVISSFQSARIAEARIKQGSSNDLVTQMKDIMVFNNGIMEAAQFIELHFSSSNKIIKEAASSFHFIYSSIIENNANFLNTLENELNNPESTAGKEGTFLIKLSKNMAANEELWRMLLYTTTFSTYCLVDRERTEEGKLKFLTITSNERKSLIKNLLNVFGDQIKKGPKGGQLPLECSASLLYQFLNKGWKSADTK